MSVMLEPVAAAAYIRDLRTGLRALRLNRHYPPWRDVSEHLGGVGILPPGEGLPLCPAGWPHPDAWLRVRIDQRLAPELLDRLAGLEAAGDAPTIAKADYLRALSAVTALQRGGLSVALIERQARRTRFEVIIDRVELSVPSLVRWTLRLSEPEGERLTADVLTAQATERFTRRLQALTTQTALTAVLLLESGGEVEVEELVRGEIGPIRCSTGRPWISAVLSRVSRALPETSVDDPLSEGMAIPRAGAGLRLSHHRKWSVPRHEQAAARAWLTAQGSRNLIYGYR
jgi:hypothetical protein